MQQGQIFDQAVERDAQLADPVARGGRFKMQDQGERRERDETSGNDESSVNNPISEEE